MLKLQRDILPKKKLQRDPYNKVSNLLKQVKFLLREYFFFLISFVTKKKEYFF